MSVLPGGMIAFSLSTLYLRSYRGGGLLSLMGLYRAARLKLLSSYFFCWFCFIFFWYFRICWAANSKMLASGRPFLHTERRKSE